jgi:predicted nucleic acid-binding protein
VYVVDASVWISRFITTDVNHTQSYLWFRWITDQSELVVEPTLVLAEVAGAVARRTGLSELGMGAVILLQNVPGVSLVSVDADLAQFSADVAARLRLRGADAIYVALAQRLGVPLITWDIEQRDRGRGIATTLTLQDALSPGSP